MKYTLFISMMVAAAGSQMFAEEPVKTYIQDAEYHLDDKANGYIGVFKDGDNAFGGEVHLQTEPIPDQEPKDLSGTTVYGGYAYSSSDKAAYNNRVVVTDGVISNIDGGIATGPVTASYDPISTGASYNNTVIVKGGKVSTILGGAADNGAAYGNVVIVSGGTVNNLYTSFAGGEQYGNRAHLVGQGATVTIKDAQGTSDEYAGHTLKFAGDVSAASNTNGHDNSIDIYGYGIEARALLNMNSLGFHLTSTQIQTDEASLILTGTSSKKALNLANVNLYIQGLDVETWMPGTTVTLVQSKQAIEGLNSGTLVDITDASGTQVLAQGKLLLTDGEEQTHLLKLTVQGVPEPATGTLGLLALAALTARRRRK